jgi:hypothetical protein
MKNTPLLPTPSHITVYRFVVAFLKKNGFAPMHSEIVAGTNVRPTNVYHVMKDLKDYEYLQIIPRRKRGILLTDKSL